MVLPVRPSEPLTETVVFLSLWKDSYTFIIDLLESIKIPSEGEIHPNHKNKRSSNMLIGFILVIFGYNPRYCVIQVIEYGVFLWRHVLSVGNIFWMETLTSIPTGDWFHNSCGHWRCRCSNPVYIHPCTSIISGVVTVSHKRSVSCPQLFSCALGPDSLLKAMRLQYRSTAFQVM